MAIFYHYGYNNLQQPTTTYNILYNDLQQLLQQNLQHPTTFSTTTVENTQNYPVLKLTLCVFSKGTDRTNLSLSSSPNGPFHTTPYNRIYNNCGKCVSLTDRKTNPYAFSEELVVQNLCVNSSHKRPVPTTFSTTKSAILLPGPSYCIVKMPIQLTETG